MPKKYYWIKLKDSFFKQLAIKKLRKVAGGDTFVIIYLKMMLLSMNNNGKIMLECVDGSTFAEDLAIELDEADNNVNMTLSFLQTHKLIEFLKDGEVFLPEVINCIGSECDSAERVRKYRENRKSLQCNNDVTPESQISNQNVTLEKEIDIEIDKESSSYSPSSLKDDDDLYHLFDKYVWPMSPKIAEELRYLEGEHGTEKLLGAVKNTIDHGGHSVGYVKQCLSTPPKKSSGNGSIMDALNKLYGGDPNGKDN